MSRLCYLLLLLSALQVFTAKSQGTTVFHNSERAVVLRATDGRIRGVSRRNDVDFVLGGLFPVHGNDGGGARCGDVFNERGLERLEAMLYSIDRINSDPNLLPNITLGFDIRDTCARENVALDESIDFALVTDASDRTSCNQQLASRLNVGPGNVTNTTILSTSAVIGAALSAVTVPVATLLRLFQLPEVSYSASSARLNNRDTYQYFYRTIPADDLQARAMVDIALHFNWTYVSIVYANDFYGQLGIDEFRRLAGQSGICIDQDRPIDSDFEYDDYQDLASDLLNSSANVAVLFASHQMVEQVLTALKNVSLERGVDRTFLWIASDAWARSRVVSQFSEALSGFFGIVPLTETDAGFHEYFSRLTLDSNLRDPWFTEYFEEFFRCNATSTCNRSQPITDRSGYRQGNFVPLVIDAVYAVTHALNNFLNENCNQPLVWFRNNHTCEGQKRELNGSALLEYIQRVNFTSPTGNMVEFDSNGNVEGRYEILNYQQKMQADGKVMYEFVNAGKWIGAAANRLILNNDTQLQFGLNGNGPLLRPRESQCTLCGPGKVFRDVPGACCGTCDNCLGQSFSNSTSNRECQMCSNKTWGNNPLIGSNSCVALEESYLRYESPWSIALMVIAAGGLSGVVIVAVIMGIFWNTAAIKSSGREQMIFLLVGISLCFLLTFFFVSKPFIVVCIFQRDGVWTCFSIMLGAILVKLIRITRIFLRGHVSTPLKCTGPWWQILFTCFVVLGQLLLALISLSVEPPFARQLIQPNAENSLNFPTILLTCFPTGNAAQIVMMVLSILYVTALLIACNGLAILTIRFPANFNESKYIAFTTFALGLIWLAFIPTFLTTAHDTQTAVISLALNLSALAVLICMFGPRVFIVICLPKLNTLEMKSTLGSSEPALNTVELTRKPSALILSKYILNTQAFTTPI